MCNTLFLLFITCNVTSNMADRVKKQSVSHLNSLTNFGAEFADRLVRPAEESGHWFYLLKTPDILKHQQKVSVSHHEGRGQHGVLPPVSYHPQSTRPQQKHKRQPADVRYTPRLKIKHHKT